MQFRFEQIIDVSKESAFAFYAKPENLNLLYRESTEFRLLHSSQSVQTGGTLWVEVMVARIMPIVLGFEFTRFEPPFRFGERLIHGPFQRFTHLHEFEEASGGCCVRDLLEVELPHQYGGELTMNKLIGPAITRAFDLRANSLKQLVLRGIIA